jgi:cytochrome c peroxidase
MRKWVEAYAKDQELFFKDFASAFQKLQELGVKPEDFEVVHSTHDEL